MKTMLFLASIIVVALFCTLDQFESARITLTMYLSALHLPKIPKNVLYLGLIPVIIYGTVIGFWLFVIRPKP